MTTGTVTMSLADIDNLRDRIKTLQDNVKQVEKERDTIKSEKRILKITITNHLSQGNNYLIKEFVDYLRVIHGKNISEYEIRSFINNFDKKYYGNNFYGSSASSQENRKEEYINFEDVILNLRKNIETEVGNELALLRNNQKNYSIQYEALRLQYENDKKDIEKEWNKKYQEILTDYNNLKEDKDTRKKEQILEEEIANLKKDLAMEKAKKWYHKIF